MSDNILKKIFYPSARGRIWQVFVLLIILVFIGGAIDSGNYYNKSFDWISNKTGGIINIPRIKDFPFRLGLDLQGGTHLVYDADVSSIESKDRDNAIEGVKDVIDRRVNAYGVSEPVVQSNKTAGGDYRVIVELAGVKDVNEAIKMIGETPLLEFKEKSDEKRELTEEEKGIINNYNQEADRKGEELLGKILSGGDFSALATEYNNDQSGGDLGWITEKDNPEVINSIKDYKNGEISKDLIKGSSGYEIFKLEDKRIKKDPFTDESEKEVKASHLLICYEGVDGCQNGLSKEDAYEKIKKIKEGANINNFGNLVKENSTEPGAESTGGELGWFGKGMMVEPFEETVFPQEKNTISYVVETQFGYHLIYKQDERDVNEYKVSRILIKTLSEEDILGPQDEWKNTELTGKYLERASVQFNPNDNSPEVSLEFDGEGSDLFEQITERNIGQQVAIFLDNYPISAPTVNDKITGGKAVISGKFDIKEAKLLAQRLNAGALPVPINLVSQKTVGASLGHNSVLNSLKAGVIGLILVALFMVVFYRFFGLLAVFSLCVYGILVLAIFKVWPVTLTLSGFAGFILSVGMAVDANVLIFERFKEEFRSGQPVKKAIENGFQRAWPSIRDGNLSTIITCIILIIFTTSIVRGFAVTLIIGIIVSMFSAIIITKNFLMLVSGEWLEKRSWIVGVKKKNKEL